MNCDRISQLTKKFHIIIAMAIYVVVTLAMTLPVVFRINSEIPKRGSDTYQVMGQIMNQTNILEQSGMTKGLKILVKNYQLNVFTPYATLGIILKNKILAYNILFYLSFILSGLGAYMLCYYFTRNAIASFFAGLVFAFSPHHFYHSLETHVGTMHQEWIPFFVLYFWKFFEDFKLKNFILSAFFILLIALMEHQLLAFTALFILIFIIFKLFNNPKKFLNKKFLVFLTGALIIFVGIGYLFFTPLFQIASSENNFLNAGMNQSERYAISLVDPLLPAPSHSLWPKFNGQAVEAIQKISPIDIKGIGEKKSSRFLGYTALFLVIALIYYFIKKRKSEELHQYKGGILFWLIIFFSFYVFALGPSIDIGKREILLPYYLVYKYLPFYENIRTTGRFFVYSVLSAAILSGISINLLFLKNKIKNIFVVIAFSLVILIEFSTWPIQTTGISYSRFYDSIAKDSDEFKLLEIPGSTSYDYASYQMITNSIHRKAVINGMAMARIIPYQFEFQKTTPIIRQLLYEHPESGKDYDNTTAGIIQNNFFGLSRDILNYYGIRYVTIQKKFLESSEDIANLKKLVTEYVRPDNVYEDDFLIAYEVKNSIPRGFYATIIDMKEKWNKVTKEKGSEVYYRSLSSGAQFLVVNMEKNPKNVRLLMSLMSKKAEKFTIETADGEKIGSFDCFDAWNDYEVAIPVLSGSNEFIFKVYDEYGKEISFSEEEKDRSKDEGVRVSNLRLEEFSGKN